jgi:hypothetical protein
MRLSAVNVNLLQKMNAVRETTSEWKLRSERTKVGWLVQRRDAPLWSAVASVARHRFATGR